MPEDIEQSIDDMNRRLSMVIIAAASQSIPKNMSQRGKTAVPWWNNKCTEVVKERNRAFKMLRKTLNMDTLMEYQRKKAMARKVIKEAKKESWRQFCSTIGRETTLNKMWMMVKKMIGKYKPPYIPVLIDGQNTAISDMDKANLLGGKFAEIHRGNHLDECVKKRKEDIMNANTDILNTREGNMSVLDVEFSLSELKMALGNTGYSSPGCDDICYAMIRNLPDKLLEKILELFNKIWNEGKIPKVWKDAIILPFPKPGKDSSNPENYRPIALTSHLGKLMEKRVFELLS